MSKKEIQSLLKKQEKMQAALDKQAKKISEMSGPAIYEYYLRYLNETVELVRAVAMMNAEMDAMLRKAAEDVYCPSLYADLQKTEKAMQSLISNLHWRYSQRKERSNSDVFYRDLP